VGQTRGRSEETQLATARKRSAIERRKGRIQMVVEREGSMSKSVEDVDV
jgi:hypothetical protein